MYQVYHRVLDDVIAEVDSTISLTFDEVLKLSGFD